MPVSRRRKKDTAAPVVAGATEPTAVKLDNPRWLVPLMVGLFLIGLAWLVVFYLAPGLAPFARLGNLWSVVVGFVFLGGGFTLATRWR
ncbi:MAG: cell division protein CrgA [Actinobacteria bacterium]|nr:cell division protein CrgA [Actinomycetota bacterium]